MTEDVQVPCTDLVEALDTIDENSGNMYKEKLASADSIQQNQKTYVEMQVKI